MLNKYRFCLEFPDLFSSSMLLFGPAAQAVPPAEGRYGAQRQAEHVRYPPVSVSLCAQSLDLLLHFMFYGSLR